MARKRRRGKRDRGGPHGDGFGDQGDLLSDDDVDDAGDVGAEVPEGEAEGEVEDHGGAQTEPGHSPDVEGSPQTEPRHSPDVEGSPQIEARERADVDGSPQAEESPDAEGLPEAEESADAGAETLGPSQTDALVEVRALAAEGQVERALERARDLLEADQESVPLLVQVADVLGYLTHFDEAEGHLKRAQRLAADEVEVRVGLGILYFRRGLYAEAEAVLDQVCQRHPEHASAHYYRGEALNRLGRVDDALELLGRAVELMPDDPRPYHTLGRLHDRKNQPEEAARMHRRARELTRG